MNAEAMDPLSDAEIEQLAERLERIKNEEALSLEGVDGLFCALIASPVHVPPSAYLPIILGGESEQGEFFKDIDDANATVSLLIRYWNSIVAEMEKETVHPPYVFEVDAGAVPGRAWARGFILGVDFAPEDWVDLFQSEEEGDVVVIPSVAGEIDPEWPKDPFTKELQDDVLMSLGVGFARSYRHFAKARRENADAIYEEDLEDEDLDEDEFYPET
jgi:yecA family protein